MNRNNLIRIRLVALVLLLLIPAWLLVCACFLPPQFQKSYGAALQDKYARLAQDSVRPRIILIGGSSLPFGVDSALLAEHISDYEVVNLGLYAALGTEPMLDLAQELVRAGDIVILSPEQNEQALSLYFGAQELWQAIDGDFSLLAALERDKRARLIGALPYFAMEKLRYVLEGAPPEPQGIYSRAAFNAYGDLAQECAANVMPGGFDTNMPISFSETVIAEDFIDAVNAFAAQCQGQGATVWYRFCPMNRLAVEGDVDAYCERLQAKLTIPIAGNPNACIMEPEWFYDTNFHLNSSGKLVNTKTLIEDIKAMLAISSASEIVLPTAPAFAAHSAIQDAGEDADCFLYAEQGAYLVIAGVSEAAYDRETLRVPASVDGKAVVAIQTGAFSQATALQTLCIATSVVQIEDGAFDGCSALRAIELETEQPAQLRVGANLLQGTAATVYVPRAALSNYRLNYFWAPHAARIEGK